MPLLFFGYKLQITNYMYQVTCTMLLKSVRSQKEVIQTLRCHIQFILKSN